MEQKWEYKIYNSLLTQDELNILGKKGWELISYTNTVNFLHKYIFKRKIQESNG